MNLFTRPSGLFKDFLRVHQNRVEQKKMVETIKNYYRVDRREISFLKFILEAYDGLAVLTTVDSEKGTVVINIAPGCEADVEMILQDLEKNVMIEKIDSKNQLSE